MEHETPHGPQERSQFPVPAVGTPRHAVVRLPRRYAPFVYGSIQAALTTALATAVAIAQTTGGGVSFLHAWLSAWVLAFLSILPVVILVAPLIQRAVLALTKVRDGES